MKVALEFPHKHRSGTSMFATKVSDLNIEFVFNVQLILFHKVTFSRGTLFIY